MGDHDPLHLVPIHTRAVLYLKSWAPDRTALSFAGDLAEEWRMLALAPGEWLMISDAIAGTALHGLLAPYAQEQGIAAVDISQGLAAFRLDGFAAYDVLSKGCGLDLHPRHFPVGSCTRTRFAKVPVIIECVHSKPHYEGYVASSYWPYLRCWLDDAAVEFQRPAP
jgi:sarcosine oxidase, subunit gamma